MNNHEDIETVFKIEEPVIGLAEGYGYHGVLLRNKVLDLIQCHICGRWVRGLSIHCRQAHKIPAKEYRLKYGLPAHFPLVSRGTSRKHSNRANEKWSLDNLKKVRDVKKLWAGNRAKKARISLKKYRNCAAFQNMNGTCPEQIQKRYLLIADKIGKEPSGRDLKKHDEALSAVIYRRYKSLNKFRRRHGFKIRKRAPIVSDETIINILRNDRDKYKKIPNPSMYRHRSPTEETIRRRFGSWHKALCVAGIVR